MKKLARSIIISLLLLTGFGFSLYAQVDFKNLQKSTANFSEDLAKSLPFNSSLGLNWSDAYIGKLFPSSPPHFGIGGSFGFTTMDIPSIKKLAGLLGYSLPFSADKMFLPAYTAEARVGGLFLPFDVGFKFGYLPPVGLWGTGMNLNYLLVGGDIRYALLDSKVWPKISLGAGVNYLNGAVGGKVGSSQEITYYNGSSEDHITLEKPDVNLKWNSIALDFTLQISKSFLIITPYLGLGGSYAWSSAGYSVDTTIIGNDGKPLAQAEIDKIKAYLSGVEGADISGSGISSMIDNNAFSLRTFGGFSVNLSVFRLDLTGLYSFFDQNYGASIGFRFQL